MPNYIKDTYEEWTAKMKEINRPIKSTTPSVPFPEGKQFSTAGAEEFPRSSHEEIKIVQPLFMRFCGAFHGLPECACLMSCSPQVSSHECYLHVVMLILKLKCKHFAMPMGNVNVVFDFEVTAVPVSELHMMPMTIQILRMASHNMVIQWVKAG